MAQNRVEAPPEGQRKLAAPPQEPRLLPGATRSNIWLQIAVGGAIALVVGMGTLELIPLLAHPIALLILAISIAAALAPLVTSLERWLPRILAVIVVYGLVFAFFGIVIQLTIPTLAVQFQRIAERLPELTLQIQSRLGGLGVESDTLVNTITPQLGQLSSTLVALPLTLLSSILELFLVLVMSIYWLLVAFASRDFFLSLFPSEGHKKLRSLMGDIARAMGGYIRATVINGFTVGFLTYVGLALIGLDYPLVLGVVAGLLEFVPIVGPMISGVIVVIAALTNSPTQALIALVFMFLLQQFEGNILVPFVMRSQTEISPLLVIIAIFAGGTIGGLLGALIAIPVVSALQVLIMELVVPELRRRLGAEEAG
jgi:predicted PurR-regulated permease PerM